MKSSSINIDSLWFCSSWNWIMFQWYNIAVGACNRVCLIEPQRVTGWQHLIHLKVYKEESPGQRRKSWGSVSIWIYYCCNISSIDSNIKCFSNLLWNKFVNMDRGICVADNAISTISSMRWCFLFSFSFHTCWSNSLSLFAVSDSPSGNVDKKWSSFEVVRGFKVKDRSI